MQQLRLHSLPRRLCGRLVKGFDGVEVGVGPLHGAVVDHGGGSLAALLLERLLKGRTELRRPLLLHQHQLLSQILEARDLVGGMVGVLVEDALGHHLLAELLLVQLAPKFQQKLFGEETPVAVDHLGADA